MLVAILAIFAASSVSAFQINTFNNSLSSETLTFTGNQNITRYLAVPQNSILTNGFFNISGFQSFSFPDSIINFYTANNTATDSLSLNNLTWTGTPNYVPGIIGSAFNFTGTNYLVSQNNAGTQISGANSRTLAMWVISSSNNPASGNGYHLVSWGTCSSGQAFGIYINHNKYEYLGCGGDFEMGGRADGVWKFLVLTYNGTDVIAYVNGTRTASSTLALNTGNHPIAVGTRFDTPGVDDAINTSIDEIGVWNRSLTDAEILNLYNSGIGKTYSSGIASPLTLMVGENLSTLSISANGTNPINITTSNLYNSVNEYLASCSIINGYCNVPFIFGSQQAGALTYSALNFNNLGFIENSQTYNATTYETKSETFLINITYDSSLSMPSATLFYNGVGYSGISSGNGNIITFSSTLDIPTGVTSGSFYWNISIGGTTFQSTNKTQTIQPITLTICNATNNVKYLNFTFLDEGNGSIISAATDLAQFNYYLGSGAVVKTYTFSNSTQNSAYILCFTPSDKLVIANIQYQYSGLGYPSRQFATTLTLSNATTNQQLYLLATAQGNFITFIALNQGGTPISGAAITIQRQFASGYVTIINGVTDSAGSFAAFVSGSFNHQISVSKTGYGTITTVLRPSVSPIDITLGGASNNTFVNSQEGYTYSFAPQTGLLPAGLNIFWLNISSAYGGMVNCTEQIVNYTGSIILEASGPAINGGTNCYATGTLNTNFGDYLKGSFFVSTTNGTLILESEASWPSLNITNSGGIVNFINDFNNINIWTGGNPEQNGELAFTKFLLVFFGIAIVAAYLNVMTNFDLMSPGAFVIPLSLFVVSFSIVGNVLGGGEGLFYMNYFQQGFLGGTGYWLNNYIFALFTLMATGIYLMTTMRRNQ